MGNKVPTPQTLGYELYTFSNDHYQKESLHSELVKSKATRNRLYSRTITKPRLDDSLESLVVQPIKALDLATLVVNMHGLVLDNGELISVPFDFLFRWIEASPHDVNKTYHVGDDKHISYLRRKYRDIKHELQEMKQYHLSYDILQRIDYMISNKWDITISSLSTMLLNQVETRTIQNTDFYKNMESRHAKVMQRKNELMFNKLYTFKDDEIAGDTFKDDEIAGDKLSETFHYTDFTVTRSRCAKRGIWMITGFLDIKGHPMQCNLLFYPPMISYFSEKRTVRKITENNCELLFFDDLPNSDFPHVSINRSNPDIVFIDLIQTCALFDFMSFFLSSRELQSVFLIDKSCEGFYSLKNLETVEQEEIISECRIINFAMELITTITQLSGISKADINAVGNLVDYLTNKKQKLHNTTSTIQNGKASYKLMQLAQSRDDLEQVSELLKPMDLRSIIDIVHKRYKDKLFVDNPMLPDLIIAFHDLYKASSKLDLLIKTHDLNEQHIAYLQDYLFRTDAVFRNSKNTTAWIELKHTQPLDPITNLPIPFDPEHPLNHRITRGGKVKKTRRKRQRKRKRLIS